MYLSSLVCPVSLVGTGPGVILFNGGGADVAGGGAGGAGGGGGGVGEGTDADSAV